MKKRSIQSEEAFGIFKEDYEFDCLSWQGESGVKIEFYSASIGFNIKKYYRANLKKGSIESIASGTAITKRAKETGVEVAHAGEANQLALNGNEIAKQIMEDAFEYLANFMLFYMLF